MENNQTKNVPEKDLTRENKVKEYIKHLTTGDKVKFCGTYGYTDTFYYCGKINGKAYFSSSPLGIHLPLNKWRKHILLPEEWQDRSEIEANPD